MANKRKTLKHHFHFKFTNDDGTERQFSVRATVRKPKAAVTLVLTADNVRRSIKAKGVGNSQTCAMAMCAKSQASAFHHPVDGFIDWHYSRAYVVSKVGRDGLPSECYVYAHHDNIAHLNDTAGGQKLLLKELVEQGDRVIRLHVPRDRPPELGRPHGRRTGERTRPVHLGVGSKRRFAVAQLGGVPSTKTKTAANHSGNAEA